MKKFCFAMLIAALPFAIFAETVRFRSGELLAAELSTVRPKIVNFDKFAYPESFDKKIYASLVVKLDQGRTLSNYDFSLDAFGTSYPCVAIKTGNGDFDGSRKDITDPKSGEKYSLLFVLDGALIGLAPQEKITLKCNFPPPELANQTVIFNTLGNKPFTAPRNIPASGKMAKE